jgi:hypothetical protein
MVRAMDASPLRRKRYEIVIRGRLSSRFGLAFEGLEVRPAPGQTVLVGEFGDQSQLHGVLERIRDFGIELVSVNVLG